MDVNQHVQTDSDRHKPGSMAAPKDPFCRPAPAHGWLSSCHGSSARACPVQPVGNRSSRLVPITTVSLCSILVLQRGCNAVHLPVWTINFIYKQIYICVYTQIFKTSNPTSALHPWIGRKPEGELWRPQHFDLQGGGGSQSTV